jgi:hypothetical protein
MMVLGSRRLRRSLQDCWAESGVARRSRASIGKIADAITVREFRTVLLVVFECWRGYPPYLSPKVFKRGVLSLDLDIDKSRLCRTNRGFRIDDLSSFGGAN